MMGLMTSKEAAQLWGISPRRVSNFCAEGRIDGAQKAGKTWVIPIDTKKPEDTRSREDYTCTETNARPFIKWAGGKSQLLDEIDVISPAELGKSIRKYAEPFVGGGAVLFHLLSKYDFEEVYVSDINKELIITYSAIRDNCDELIKLLSLYQDEVYARDMSQRKEYYLEKREQFNKIIDENSEDNSLDCAALFILLNKTCFNGMYRVNNKGHFNVPCGVYKKPLICDDENIRKVSKKLQGVILHHGSYKDCFDFVDDSTFVYFDPPYRPLSDTSCFNEYAGKFDDSSQIELASFFNILSKKGAYVALSNADPKNERIDDEFFDELFKGNYVHRVFANRMINSNGSNRGTITEILVTNYEVPTNYYFYEENPIHEGEYYIESPDINTKKLRHMMIITDGIKVCVDVPEDTKAISLKPWIKRMVTEAEQ